MSEANIHHGDCLEVLRSMPDGSVDAIVTDPPYGLSFMGKKWDYDAPSVEIWVECLRVLKPGGHLLAFAGTRTQHRMAVRIEDAGFEIRDMIAWVYGSGFPKSLDVSKAIDRAAGAEREVVGRAAGTGKQNPAWNGTAQGRAENSLKPEYDLTAPATPEAQQWAGWGTALKPALEPITMARKPLAGTVAANVLEHGTGALNVDGCRVEAVEGRPLIISHGDGFGSGEHVTAYGNGLSGSRHGGTTTTGRWPANLIHDGSDEVVGLFPVTTSGAGNKNTGNRDNGQTIGNGLGAGNGNGIGGDSGSAARFFYCAKASKADRDEGNNHPTVKPTDLMRYLCRLVTPPGGIVLDPFMGSGSTGKAAVLEGFRFIGIERDPQYIKIARARVAAVRREPEQAVLI
jgi:site-specific DNA-methyltransferase (adenine-specific)